MQLQQLSRLGRCSEETAREAYKALEALTLMRSSKACTIEY